MQSHGVPPGGWQGGNISAIPPPPDAAMGSSPSAPRQPYCTSCIMPQGTTVSMATMTRSERFSPVNMLISLAVVPFR